MFTQWQQVEDWIKNNQLDKWIFTKNDRNLRPSEGGTPNDKIVDSEYYPGDSEQKLQLTKQALEQYGSRVYGYGFQGKRATDGMYCEVCLTGAGGYNVPIGVGAALQPSIDRDELKKQIMNEIKLEQFEKDRQAFEAEKREFQKDKEGVMGLAISYLKPVVSALSSKRIAGLDATEDVVTPRVSAPAVPGAAAPAAEEEEAIFTDEEQDKLYDILARFKKVEPDYLRLLESVVAMAEAGDSTYTMAKGFLIKD